MASPKRHLEYKIKRTYSCSVCGKNLSSTVALSSHLKIHSGIKSFCCEHCGAMYSTKQNLIAHLIRVHGLNTESIRKCNICGKQFFRKSAFVTHSLIHSSQKTFHCHICNKSFRQKITRDFHVATHTGEYKYSCSKCDKKFLSSYKFKVHQQKHIDDVCEKQIKVCDDVLKLRDRRLEEVNVSLNLSGNSISNDELMKMKITDSSTCVKQKGIGFFCSMVQCSRKSFKTKALLKKHILQSHAPTRSLSHDQISCKLAAENQTEEQCEMLKVPSESNKSLYLTEDIPEKHFNMQSKCAPEAEEFSCGECFKHFKTSQGLEYHRKAHRGIYNCICEICGKLFIRNTHLVSHVKLHSDIRPYKCVFCEKSYKSNKNLKEHLKIKHSST